MALLQTSVIPLRDQPEWGLLKRSRVFPWGLSGQQSRAGHAMAVHSREDSNVCKPLSTEYVALHSPNPGMMRVLCAEREIVVLILRFSMRLNLKPGKLDDSLYCGESPANFILGDIIWWREQPSGSYLGPSSGAEITTLELPQSLKHDAPSIHIAQT